MSKCDDMTDSQASFNQIKTGIRILRILPGGSRSILISVGEPVPFSPALPGVSSVSL